MLSYKEAVKFHGHEGPFLVIGYKIGRFAVKHLKPEKWRDIKCIVYTIPEKPYICVMDGVQCSTPCTAGKGNIELKKVRKGIKVIFYNFYKNKEIGIRVLPEAIEKAMSGESLKKLSKEFLKMSSKKIMEILYEKEIRKK